MYVRNWGGGLTLMWNTTSRRLDTVICMHLFLPQQLTALTLWRVCISLTVLEPVPERPTGHRVHHGSLVHLIGQHRQRLCLYIVNMEPFCLCMLWLKHDQVYNNLHIESTTKAWAIFANISEYIHLEKLCNCRNCAYTTSWAKVQLQS